MSADSGTHHLGYHAMLRLVITALLALALILTLEVSPAAAATSSVCQVKNADTGRTYPGLQQAVKVAKPGDRLILTGTCHGKTAIDKDLVIVGKRTRRSGKPTIEGWFHRRESGPSGGRILSVRWHSTVTLRSLTIRSGGRVVSVDGGGIMNYGKLTLRDVTVRDYHAPNYGGGILNEGTLTLAGRTLITNNRASEGGGVYQRGRRAALRLEDSSRIKGNWAAWLGGGVASVRGPVILNDTSRISGNVAFGGDSSGGGVEAYGRLILNDSSRISGNRAVGTTKRPGRGGGVSGAVTLNDASSINGNSSSGPGGGVNGAVTLNDASSISNNTAGAEGGGVFNEWNGTVTMTGSSSISNNTAHTHGGGLFNARSSYDGTSGILDGVFCAAQTYANVHGNTPDDCYFEP